MEQILAHLVGDYFLQPNQLAQAKLTKWWAAILHGFLYTLPFMLLTQDIMVLEVIMFTHAIIDRFRLAKYIARLKNWQFSGDGYPDETPIWLRVWLMIITDNTMHLLINYAALRWL